MWEPSAAADGELDQYLLPLDGQVGDGADDEDGISSFPSDLNRRCESDLYNSSRMILM